MTTAVAHSHLRRGLPPQLRWITVLLVGSALYGAVLAALLGTQDILYVPSLLVIGAAVAPATFTTFIGGLLGRGRLSVVQIAIAAALGGVIGTVVAGTLEYETIRTLGSLPTLAIGFIEESAKLAVPAVILGWRRPLPTDGLLLGVAVASGFAALETMGYAFAALLHSGGRLEPVTQLLTLRSVAEPGGHAAWTGLACAALFAIRGARSRWLGWLRFCLVFAGAVVLHALWDSSTADVGYRQRRGRTAHSCRRRGAHPLRARRHRDRPWRLDEHRWLRPCWPSLRPRGHGIGPRLERGRACAHR
jgi:hypothetical protein